MGWLCLEEMIWGDKAHPWVKPGHLFTKGPGENNTFVLYNINPGFQGSLCHILIPGHLFTKGPGEKHT
jgi:xanthine dehydrogenase/oxidase